MKISKITALPGTCLRKPTMTKLPPPPRPNGIPHGWHLLLAAAAAAMPAMHAMAAVGPPVIRGVCPAGTYNDTGLEWNTSPCFAADVGYYVAAPGSTSQTPAALGQYVDVGGATAPKLAQLGQYVDTVAASAPKTAQLGRYVDTVGASAAKVAQLGRYVDTVGASAAKVAQLGRYVDTVGASAAKLAPLGRYVDTVGASSTKLAPLGRYVDTTGASAAKIASPGYFVASVGQSSAQAASPGHYVDTSGASAAKAAPVGYYVSQTAAVAPTAAQAGRYAPSSGLAAALNCQAGSNSYGAASACRITSASFAGNTASVVSPRLDSTIGTGGSHALGSMAAGDSFKFEVRNATTDSANQPELTLLTLNSYTLGGSSASWFSLAGFTDGMTLAPGDMADLTLLAKPGRPAGAFSLTLTLSTDQFADPGALGQSFVYTFNGVAMVPEPASAVMALAGLGLLGVLLGRRRKGHALA